MTSRSNSRSNVLDVALARLGLAAFRPGQREVIEAVLAGRPTIAVLPTGAGKSLCYQLPAIALGGLSVVISPLIALMKDQVDALNARDLPATFINSSIAPGERNRRLHAALRGDIRLLYVAPERFWVPAFSEALAQVRPTLFAIDEAHCIVQWGHDFRPDYARLGEVVQRFKPPHVVALTATATPDVRRQIRAQLGLVNPAVFVRGFDRPNLRLGVIGVQGDRDKLERCVTLLNEPDVRVAPSIIYVATRKKAEEVALSLCDRGIAARAYHAGLSDAERVEVQEQWMVDRRLRAVVATNAFGMGVDKRDVRLVVHHDVPGAIEAYYQEAGRAGRDGLPARCVLLFNYGDVKLREFLINAPAADGHKKPAVVIAAELERLRAMIRYAYATGCRRAFLHDYFGDEVHACSDEASACDNCGTIARPVLPDDDQHLLVRKVLSCVARLDGCYERRLIALCLIGSSAPELSAAGLHRVSTYGVLRGRSPAYALELLRALEVAGLVEPQGAEPSPLRLTAAGRDVMLDRLRRPLAFPRPRQATRQARGSRRR